MKKTLRLPKFKNEDEERDFWAKIDLADYFEPGDFIRTSFPNLKPTPTRLISIRIDESTLSRVKALAKTQSVPYQTLMKHYIAVGVAQDRPKKKTR